MLQRAVVVTGNPGTRWVNRTGKVRYQLIVSWQNSCGQCIARDRMIGPLWPLPFHTNCRCQQLSIHPKEKAQLFIDFAARVDELPPSEQGRVVGVAALKLIQAGEVKWKDVVTPAGIRSLADVVRAKGLTVDQLVGAGVTRGVAERAHAAAQGVTPVPTPAQIAAARARAEAQAQAARAKAEAAAQAKAEAEAAAKAKAEAEAAAKARAEAEAAVRVKAEAEAQRKAEAAAKAQADAARVAAEQARIKAEAEAKAAAVAKAAAEAKAAAKAAARAKAAAEREAQAEAARKAAAAAARKEAEAAAKAQAEAKAKAKARAQAAAKEVKATPATVAAGNKALYEARRTQVEADLSRIGGEVAQLQAAYKAASGDARDTARKDWFAALERESALKKVASRLDEYPKLVKSNPNLIPPGAIAQRLKEYTAGDDRVSALVGLRGKIDPLKARYDAAVRERTELGKQFEASGYDARFPGAARLKQLYAEAPALSKQLQEEQDRVRAAALEILKAADPIAVKWDLGDHHDGYMALDRLKGDALQRADEAARWLAQVVGRGGMPEEITTAVGAFPADQKQRAYAAKRGNVLSMAPTNGVHTYVHEFGHVLDYRLRSGDQTAVDRSQEFLAYRVADEQPVKLKDVFPNSKYRDDEVGRKDRFDAVFDESAAYYVGKDYGQDATEILSMGMEQLYQDPTGFAQKDPEYAKYVLGMLDGSLR